ncbi:ATP-binding protein [Trinickia mobilis]|uniref:ATP-binding protein n=1 Tax=Trinickia mobilis TaxID=2816356 RepID=UPI001A907BA1|nr:ATP-binding protein [Trinickia mobilis]
MPASIRRRLVFLILASIALVWTVALVSSFRHAAREVEEWEDARLAEFAQFLVVLNPADLAALAKTHIDARDEYDTNHANSTDDEDPLPRDILLQVRDAGGRILASSPELGSLPGWDARTPAAPGICTLTLGGKLWHAYTLRDNASGRTVRVLEPANTRSDLATGAARRISRPIAFALPILALLVWISIGHSLAPLRMLSNAIRTRDVGKLEPIEMGPTPTEVRPLVDAINQLLARLALSIKRERAFTSDAAHELKTPLAAIKVQAQVALGATDTASQQLAMQRVVQGVDRSAHLAGQLLLLARLDEHDPLPAAPVELDTLARHAIAAKEPNARRKGMQVALIDGEPCEVVAEPLLMGILLDNLIDNAIKYGDAGGRVEVAIRRDTRAVLLTVRDDGPGVTAEDRARLTDRFFRCKGAGAGGSGLGLSIVARIVEYFGAQLTFDAGIGGAGLGAEVAFPAAVKVPARVTSAAQA